MRRMLLMLTVGVLSAVGFAGAAAAALPYEIQYGSPTQGSFTPPTGTESPCPAKPTKKTLSSSGSASDTSQAGDPCTKAGTQTKTHPKTTGKFTPSKPSSLATTVEQALPFTGLNLLVVLLAGGSLLAAGVLVRRRARRQT